MFSGSPLSVSYTDPYVFLTFSLSKNLKFELSKSVTGQALHPDYSYTEIADEKVEG